MPRKNKVQNKAQLEFDLKREREPDRNAHLGGRSFYFFDFDDNVAYLSTPIIIFHKETGEELSLSSGIFAQNSKKIGLEGPYKDYFLNFDDSVGSFRYFRDENFNFFEKIQGKKQTFVQDIREALEKMDYHWKAPSWNCFYHATFNKRPTSIITARGHHKKTIREGIKEIVHQGHLPHDPNYLSIFPVSNPDTRKQLGDNELKSSVPDLKRSAIRESVDLALRKYGYSPHHRFGMSDDDPKNVEMITEEMRALKRKFPEMSFFVIHTTEDGYDKMEVKANSTRRRRNIPANQMQLDLFN